jgi:actin-like ATPase involved in cell morphogenesis
MTLTPEMRRLNEKRERLMAKRVQLPEDARTAIDAEIRVIAEQLARLVAVAQGATEPAIGVVFAEWVETPTRGPLADDPKAEPQIVDLRSKRRDAA